MDTTTTTQDAQVEAVMGLLSLFGEHIAMSVQDKLNAQYAGRLVVLNQQNGNASEYADRLEEIIEAVGCGQLPEISQSDIDLSEIAREAADAAYSAVESAIENADVPEIDTSELESAQDALTDALSGARSLLADMRNVDPQDV